MTAPKPTHLLTILIALGAAACSPAPPVVSMPAVPDAQPKLKGTCPAFEIQNLDAHSAAQFLAVVCNVNVIMVGQGQPISLKQTQQQAASDTIKALADAAGLQTGTYQGQHQLAWLAPKGHSAPTRGGLAISNTSINTQLLGVSAANVMKLLGKEGDFKVTSTIEGELTSITQNVTVGDFVEVLGGLSGANMVFDAEGRVLNMNGASLPEIQRPELASCPLKDNPHLSTANRYCQDLAQMRLAAISHHPDRPQLLLTHPEEYSHVLVQGDDIETPSVGWRLTRIGPGAQATFTTNTGKGIEMVKLLEAKVTPQP